MLSQLALSDLQLRALNMGQDRFRRRLWILPHAGGAYFESLESAEANAGKLGTWDGKALPPIKKARWEQDQPEANPAASDPPSSSPQDKSIQEESVKEESAKEEEGEEEEESIKEESVKEEVIKEDIIKEEETVKEEEPLKDEGTTPPPPPPPPLLPLPANPADADAKPLTVKTESSEMEDNRIPEEEAATNALDSADRTDTAIK